MQPSPVLDPSNYRLQEVEPHSFIFEMRDALPAELCRQIIQRFEAAVDEQYQGLIGQTLNKDQSVKRSTDLVLSGKPHWKDMDQNLFRSLGLAMRELPERYPYFKGPFKDKDAREHFEIRTHKRLIDIYSPTPRTVDSLMRLDLPAGVDIEIKA